MMTILLMVDIYTMWNMIFFAVAAFMAGFMDSVVGGGGLIQLPSLLIGLPQSPIATIFGTNKIAAVAGTSVSAYQYSQRVKYEFRVLIPLIAVCMVFSYLGALCLTWLDADMLKPVMLFILIGIAIYTFFKKQLGDRETKSFSLTMQLVYGGLLSMVVGFYDGFFGPGTGSFFVLGFVVILGFEFLKASAYAKMMNVSTNLAALSIFVYKGHYILGLAILMAVFNFLGGFLGTKIALKKGNQFVRRLFLFVIVVMIIRYGYDIFFS